MMKQILGTILALLLMAAPAGVAYGQGGTASDSTDFDVVLKTFGGLQKAKNTFSDKCTKAKLTLDSIKNHLEDIQKEIEPDEGDWPQAYGKEHADSLSFFVNICREINKKSHYDNSACDKFIKAYIDNKIADIDSKKLAEAQENRPSSEKGNEVTTTTSSDSSEKNVPAAQARQSDLPALIQIHQQALQSDLTRLTHILYLLLALGGITFIFLVALFFKRQRPAGTYPKDPVRDDRDANNYATHTSVKQLGEKVQALEQTLKLLDGDVKARFPLPGTTRPVTTTTMPPSTPTYTQPPVAAAGSTVPPFTTPSAGFEAETNNPPTGFTTLYVSVKAGELNTLFKQTPIFAREHLYEIHLNSPDAQEGELHICPNISPEFARKFINQRMQYLQPCAIVSLQNNAERISMVSSGRVQKRGSEWIVTTPPEVRLI